MATNKDKSNRRLVWFIVIGSVLIVVLAGIRSCIMSEERKLIDEDTILWEQSKTEDNTLSYSKYLIRFPEGKYTKEAEIKLKELENKSE